MPPPNHKGWRTSGGLYGDDTDSDGASLAGPQPYEGTNESFPGVLPVPSECGLKPKGIDRPNPMVGFHVFQGVEEVNAVFLFTVVRSLFR